MGYHHDIKIRAGPNLPPAQRRPGPAPPARVPSHLKIIVILPLGRNAMVSPPLHPAALPSAPPLPPFPRQAPRVDEVALRLRLPAEQALCGDAMPIGVRMFPSPAWSAVGPLGQPQNARIHRIWPK